MVVQASVDAKPTKIDIDTGDAQQRDKIRAQVVAVFGDPHPDTRTVQRPYKWGLIQVTDLCGRVVSPSPSAPPG